MHASPLSERYASRSPWSVRDWQESLDILRGWLIVKNRPLAEEEKLLGYISCCSERTCMTPGIYPSLSSCVEEMLEQYGFLG